MDFLQILFIYWIPTLIYLLVWVGAVNRKNDLSDMNKFSIFIVFLATFMVGFLIIFWITPSKIKNGELP